MAITFVGATTGSAINGGNATVTLASSRVAGDYIVVAVTQGTSKTSTLTVTTSSGLSYTQIVTTIVSSLTRFGVFRRILGSSDETSIIIGGTGGSSDCVTAVSHIFDGVDPTTPEDVTATSTIGSGTTPDSPSITVVTSNDVIVSAVGNSIVGGGITAPASFSDATNVTGNDTRDATTAQAWILNNSTSAFSPGSWTSTAAAGWCSATIALRPFIPPDLGYPLPEVTSADEVAREARRTVVRSY